MSRDLRVEIAGCLRFAGSMEQHLLRLRKFSSREWEASLNWLHLSGIALTFWDRLQKLGAEGAVPSRLGAGLASNLADHRLRVAAMTQELDALNRQFERAGIQYALWKGFALVPEFCRDASLRPTYDYDYLVAGKDEIRAYDVLQGAGYVRKPHHEGEHHVTFAPPVVHSGALNGPAGYYSRDLPRRVELHQRLWDARAFHIPLRAPGNLLDRKLRRELPGLVFYSLADEDALVFQALHAFQHILHNWCRLGWLWEIAYFLENHSQDTAFWVKFHDHLKENQPLAEVVALVFALAVGLFHPRLPAPLKDWIRGAMRNQISLWVDHYGLCSALDNFSENKYALFLYREFVQDESTWRQIRRSRLLPVHRPNRVASAAQFASSSARTGVRRRANWQQEWYVVKRLIHHSLGAAAYAWESARWGRLRRQKADRALVSG